MAVLVAAAVVGVNDPAVGGKIRDGVSALLGRARQLRRLAAGHRHRVDVVNPCLVTVKQDRLFIGGKGAATDANSIHKLLDGVFLDRLGQFGFLREGGAAGENDCQQSKQ